MIKKFFLIGNAVLTASGTVSFFGGKLNYSTIVGWIQWVFSGYRFEECFIAQNGISVGVPTLETYTKWYIVLLILMNSVLLISMYFLKKRNRSGMLGDGWLSNFVGSFSGLFVAVLSMLTVIAVHETIACESGVYLYSIGLAALVLILSGALHLLYIFILWVAFSGETAKVLFFRLLSRDID